MPAPPKNSKKIQGYAATYDIALYERYSGADDYFIIDGHKRYLKDLSTEEITVLREKGYESRCDWDDWYIFMQMVPKQYLKNVSAVVRVKQGCGKPTRIYLAESEGRKTDRQEGRKTVPKSS